MRVPEYVNINIYTFLFLLNVDVAGRKQCLVYVFKVPHITHQRSLHFIYGKRIVKQTCWKVNVHQYKYMYTIWFAYILYYVVKFRTNFEVAFLDPQETQMHTTTIIINV